MEEPQKKKSILRRIAGVCIYFLIMGAILFGVPKFLSWYLGTAYPMAAITSGSMWPVLKTGDLVFIQKVAPSDVRVGDIIVYESGQYGFVIHRVIEVRPDKFITKGDANFSADDPIVQTALVGRAFSFRGAPVRLPYLGSITVFAHSIH